MSNAWRDQRVDLGVRPTPVTHDEDLGMWLKDDGCSAPVYGGNKPRKLEYILHEAPRQVATMGAMGSHHCLATALHGVRFGHEVHVVTFPRPHSPHVEQVIARTAAVARMHHMDDIDAAKARLAELGRAGALAVPAGGSSPRGALGFVRAGEELVQQVDMAGLPRPDVVVAAMGTAGTVVGLSMALAHAGWHTRVRAVRVVPEAWLHRDDLVELAQGVAALTGLAIALPEVDDGWLGTGYGEATGAAAAAVRRARHAAQLETTYTGKALAAALQDTAANVLFWQTHNAHDITHLPQGETPANWAC